MKKVILGLSMMAQLAVAKSNDTYVLVHGALFNSDSWVKVESLLRDQGQSVVSFDVPGRRGDGLQAKDVDLDLAVTRLAKVVEAQSGSVILVGHSQGGALITQAIAKVGHKIKGLVYLSAVVPDDGETAFEKLSQKTQENFGATVTPDPEHLVFHLSEDKNVLEHGFFQDLRAVHPDLADLALAGMVAEPMNIGLGKLSYSKELFASIPKYYIETLQDGIVDIENQRHYQKTFQFNKVFSIDAGHSPFLSKAEDVVKVLGEIQQDLHLEQAPSTEQVRVVEEFYQAFAKGDFARVVGLIADDIQWNQPGQSVISGVYNGKSSVIELFGKFGALSAGTLKLVPYQIMQNKDEVAVILEFSAHSNGKSISSKGLDIFKVVGGQIVEATLFTEFQKAEDQFWGE